MILQNVVLPDIMFLALKVNVPLISGAGALV
uniref:Uncharacterized protein n=1 Tax=Anguilla anguilla TaxID=7936 RepID=A0A0E9SKH6_ANGAN